MKSTISKIDRALKRLYNLGSALQAEDFLLNHPIATTEEKAPPGVLYIQPPTPKDDSLSLGIYLHASVREELGRFSQWGNTWTGSQIKAFAVAAEEVSHFNYVAYHAP